MTDELTRRRLLLTALICGAGLVVSGNVAFAKDGEDDDSGSDDSGSDDSDDDDDSGGNSGSSGSDDDDDEDDDDNSGSGSGSSGSGSGKSGSGKKSKSRAQRELDRATQAVKDGKAVSLRKLMAHVKAAYGGKVLDVKLSRSLFRYSYSVKHLGKDGRLQTLRLDALSLKKL